MTDPIIENNFSYHPPKNDQPEQYQHLREEFKTLAYLLVKMCPPGRERSTAMTHLESAMMWANASIARS